MKHVFPSPEPVAHRWANQLQTNARTSSGNYYFQGLTVYSYGSHFPIAKLIPDRNAVLFTLRTYSNTTSKHIWITRSACSQYKRVYCFRPDASHEENVEYFENQAMQIADANLRRARKPEKYFSQIAQFREYYLDYVDFFPEAKSIPVSFVHVTNMEEYQRAVEGHIIQVKKANRLSKLRRTLEAKKRAKIEAERLDNWRLFEPVYVYSSEYSYLRYNAETNRIETSQRVEIPVEIAKHAYLWIKQTAENGGCKDGECGGMKVMDFDVKYVTAEEFRVGCHLIKMSEAEAIAKALNW